MKSFNEVSKYLNSLINYEVEFPLGGSRDRPKLDPVYAAARALLLPLVLPKCIHIAGTVGKGSTAAMTQALLSVHHSVLSFTSPHLVSPKERVQLDGRDLSDELWCEGISAIRDGMLNSDTKLTYFETTFVFYLWCAKKLGTTAHVVETGLGGSFDATNVLERTTAVLTRVDLDHTHILGKTFGAIAKDKSGIIKEGMSCFSVAQEAEAMLEVENSATAKHAALSIEEREFRCEQVRPQVFRFRGKRAIDDISIPLAGEFQKHNLAVSLAATLSLDGSLTDDEIRSAFRDVRLRGRQEVLDNHPNVMIDVCHNPASFAELAASLRADKRFSKRIALVAMMKDKDARESLRHLIGVVDELWVTDAPTPRTYSADALLEIANELHISTRVVNRVHAYKDILSLPDNIQGIVCGSFYLVGDFLSAHPDA
ncbi:MAG: hypothetical protein IPP40_05780 [bacterium]|nr:hypothetical protein [bacterium]